MFTNAVSFLLLPLYTRFLTQQDYGVLAILLLFSTVAKVLFRMGLDGAFLRLHYDMRTEGERRLLAGSVALFAAGAGTLLFGAVVLWAPQLTRLLFSAFAPPPLFVTLAAADVYLGTFAYVPQALLRIEGRAGAFSAFALLRHTLNIGLKVVLVVRGLGVAGVLWSDAIATGVFALALLPILLRRAALGFSWRMLREALGFGLPRVPHGLMLQAQNLADRRILEAFVDLGQVGLYQVGYTFGTAVKFALSAFEPAWQPFVYASIRQPDAPRVLSRVVTYVAAAFVAVGLGVAVLARELVQVMTAPPYHVAAPLVPVVTLAYVLHGGFLLTSIGIAIEKRARYYPLITAASAGANLAANFALIPRFGMMGAAWATVLSYALMAGLGFAISRRLYPIPFEAGRLARLCLCAALVYAASCLAPEALLPALLAKGALLLAFPLLVLLAGTATPEERDRLRGIFARRAP